MYLPINSCMARLAPHPLRVRQDTPPTTIPQHLGGEGRLVLCTPQQYGGGGIITQLSLNPWTSRGDKHRSTPGTLVRSTPGPPAGQASITGSILGPPPPQGNKHYGSIPGWGGKHYKGGGSNGITLNTSGIISRGLHGLTTHNGMYTIETSYSGTPVPWDQPGTHTATSLRGQSLDFIQLHPRNHQNSPSWLGVKLYIHSFFTYCANLSIVSGSYPPALPWLPRTAEPWIG